MGVMAWQTLAAEPLPWNANLKSAGNFTRAETVIPCNPGVSGIMPVDQVHRAKAGDKGLRLTAIFSPPRV